MKNSRIIRLIRLLNPAEIRKFVQFVESPFFNQNEKLLKLARIIHEASPEFGEATLEKERVFRLIYGKTPTFDEQKIHDLISQLHRLFEKFLAVQEFEKDEVAMKRYLMYALSNRNETDHYNRIYKSATKRLVQKKKEYPKFHLQEFLLEEHLVEFALKNGNYKASVDSFNSLVTSLDTFYLTERLKYSVEKLRRDNSPSKEETDETSTFFAELLENVDFTTGKSPIVSTYYQLYKLQSDFNDDTHFNDLLDLLSTHEEELSTYSSREIYYVYVQAQNYCVKKINSGKREYIQHLFSIYLIMLEKKLLIKNGYMDHHVYKNIAANGLFLKKYDWTYEFLNSYKRKIHPEQQENAYTYNMAKYHYEKEEYRQSMKLIQQVDFPNWRYHLGAKFMLLRIYFELGDEDGLSYLVQALKVYLHRHKEIPKYQSKIHTNMMRFTQKMLQLKQSSSYLKKAEINNRLHKLKEKIASTQGIAYESWLKQKLNELLEQNTLEIA
ncbi:MAG: hypothetical protein AAF388_10075 [Bacteroidota bacterium]